MKLRKTFRKLWLLVRYWYTDRVLQDVAAPAKNGGIDIPEYRGKMPKSIESSLIVFTVADGNYFDRFGKAFLGSVLENSHGTQVHLHLYNPTNSQLEFIDKLTKDVLGSSVSVTWETINLDHLHGEDYGRYICFSRFLRLSELVKSTGTNCLLLDIDALVVKSTTQLLTDIGEADVAFYARFHKAGIDTKMLGGTLYVASTNNGKKFAELISSKLERFVSHGKFLEKLDQIVIYDEFTRFRKTCQNFKFYLFDDRVIDLSFSGGSIIWYPKGDSRMDGVFMEKVDEYDKLLETKL